MFFLEILDISLVHFFKRDISFVLKCQKHISNGGIHVMNVSYDEKCRNEHLICNKPMFLS